MTSNLLRHTCIVLLLAASALTAAARTTIRGKVIDGRTGEALVGVTVIVGQGADAYGTTTDAGGSFTIGVDKLPSVLTFTHIGYEALYRRVNSESNIIVSMVEDPKYIDEVVVIGYQDIRRSDVTGSIGSADVADMMKAPVGTFDAALAGRVAGVLVSSNTADPGQALSIVIRGKNSLTQDNNPLYIVDGFPYDGGEVSVFLNPADIETIDVLKDASATAIYGSRGANGVVLITTKKGKAGEMTIRYDFSAGIHQVANPIKVMDAYEFVRLQEELWNPEDLYSSRGYYATYEGKQYTLEDYRNAEWVDWQDMVLRTALQQNHNVSLSGGSEDSRYMVSLSYFDQDGIVLNSNYNRLQGRVNLTARKNKLNTNVNVNYSRVTRTGVSPSNAEGNAMYNLFNNVWSYRSVAYPGQSLNDLISNLEDADNDDLFDYRYNPYLSRKNEYGKATTNAVMFNLMAEYDITPYLKLQATGAVHYYQARNESFNNSLTRAGRPGNTNGVNGGSSNPESISYQQETTLTFNKRFKKHITSAVVGTTFNDGRSKSNSMSFRQIPYESLVMDGLTQGTYSGGSYTTGQSGMASFFGRINYNYNWRYYLTATFRADGSSRFASRNRWGYFPSMSAAWNLHNEDFFRPLKKIVPSARIRAGWGQVGNNRVGDYTRFAAIDMSRGDSYAFNNNNDLVGFIPTRLENQDLKWETTTQTNIGLDVSFLEERIHFTMDWYYKITSDLLFQTEIPLSSGFGSAMRNIGEVRNKGIEFSLRTTNIKTPKFRWTSSFNISFNKNRVAKLAEGVETLMSVAAFDATYNSMPSYMTKIGLEMGMMYGYIYDGTYKLDEFDQGGTTYTLKKGIPSFVSEQRTQPGMPKYRDLNGDGKIDSNDRTIIGRADPKHYGGFNNNFEYKNFDLNIFLQWNYGNNILNANRLMFEGGPYRRNYNQYMSYKNRWTFDNPDSDIPAFTNSSSNAVFSSRVIENGSYLRIKTVALGYTIPPRLLAGIGITRLRVYASAQNLYTFTKYSGYDPEVAVRGNGLTPGFDYSAYPRTASYIFGINLTF